MMNKWIKADIKEVLPIPQETDLIQALRTTLYELERPDRTKTVEDIINPLKRLLETFKV